MRKGKTLFTIFFILFSLLVTSCSEDPVPVPYISSGLSSTDGTEETEDFTPPTRPDGAVYLQSGFCACDSEGNSVILGACESFCSEKSPQVETLYLETTVDESISLSDLIDFGGWCTQPIQYEDPTTGEIISDGVDASCQAVLTDENGNQSAIDFNTFAGATSLELDISNLSDNLTYRLQIEEVTSGARSNTIQFRKYGTRFENRVPGPLAISPVTQYTCLERETSLDSQNALVFFETAERRHFYFIDDTRPEPLSGLFSNIYCHDFLNFGLTPINNPLLEESPGVFSVWNHDDPRFYDGDSTGVIDINEILLQGILDQGSSLASAPEIFFPLEYPRGPTIDGSTTDSGAGGSKLLGYYMVPFIDDETFRAYCPDNENYYSSNVLFRSMREVIGVETEGLYVAKQNNACDFILVKESLLTQIWFYIEDGQHIQPNDQTVRGKNVQFYWPADTDNPFIRKSDQRVFTVLEASEVGDCSNNNISDTASSTQSSYPTHDKRIGCIPKL